MFKATMKFNTAGDKTTPLMLRIGKILTTKTMTMNNSTVGIIINLFAGAPDSATKIQILIIKEIFLIPAADLIEKRFGN